MGEFTMMISRLESSQLDGQAAQNVSVLLAMTYSSLLTPQSVNRVHKGVEAQDGDGLVDHLVGEDDSQQVVAF